MRSLLPGGLVAISFFHPWFARESVRSGARHPARALPGRPRGPAGSRRALAYPMPRTCVPTRPSTRPRDQGAGLSRLFAGVVKQAERGRQASRGENGAGHRSRRGVPPARPAGGSSHCASLAAVHRETGAGATRFGGLMAKLAFAIEIRPVRGDLVGCAQPSRGCLAVCRAGRGWQRLHEPGSALYWRRRPRTPALKAPMLETDQERTDAVSRGPGARVGAAPCGRQTGDRPGTSEPVARSGGGL